MGQRWSFAGVQFGGAAREPVFDFFTLVIRGPHQRGSPRCSRFVGLTRRIGRVFRDIRVHVIPWLSALDEDVSLGPKPAWIVEAGDPDAHEIRPG